MCLFEVFNGVQTLESQNLFITKNLQLVEASQLNSSVQGGSDDSFQRFGFSITVNSCLPLSVTLNTWTMLYIVFLNLSLSKIPHHSPPPIRRPKLKTFDYYRQSLGTGLDSLRVHVLWMWSIARTSMPPCWRCLSQSSQYDVSEGFPPSAFPEGVSGTLVILQYNYSAIVTMTVTGEHAGNGQYKSHILQSLA